MPGGAACGGNGRGGSLITNMAGQLLLDRCRLQLSVMLSKMRSRQCCAVYGLWLLR